MTASRRCQYWMEFGKVDVFLQAPGGTLALSRQYTVTYGSSCDMEAGDVNGDGLMDIAITSYGAALGLCVLVQSNATFAPAVYNHDHDSKALLSGVGIGDVDAMVTRYRHGVWRQQAEFGNRGPEVYATAKPSPLRLTRLRSS